MNPHPSPLMAVGLQISKVCAKKVHYMVNWIANLRGMIIGSVLPLCIFPFHMVLSPESLFACNYPFTM